MYANVRLFSSATIRFLPRRREHLHARALQIRAELSTHIQIEIGPYDPHTVVGVFFLRKQNSERGKCYRLSASARRTMLFAMLNDDKFTPTKHLTPPPHHSNLPAAAHTNTETPLLHQNEG